MSRITSPMLERLEAKVRDHEELRPWEDGYLTGWTTCQATMMAEEIERAMKGARE